MSLLHFRCKERRRTLRVALTVPLTVHGRLDTGERFCAQTASQSINRHGVLFPLEEVVLEGQTLIEFLSPETNFWHMEFPIPGTKPLRRIVPSKASA